LVSLSAGKLISRDEEGWHLAQTNKQPPMIMAVSRITTSAHDRSSLLVAI
jgi:hypothetical protein